jgi:AraC-like DNA-binding protein
MSLKKDSDSDWERSAADCKYNLALMAKTQGLSVRTLRRRFRETFGLPPKIWIDRLRAKAVIKHILRGDLVKTAAANNGFKQRSHLSKFLKRLTGKAPSFIQKSPVAEMDTTLAGLGTRVRSSSRVA